MPRLTAYSLNELENVGKQYGWDLDKIRKAYWDEMLSEGFTGTPVEAEAKRLRKLGKPVEAERQESPWYEDALSLLEPFVDPLAESINRFNAPIEQRQREEIAKQEEFVGPPEPSRMKRQLGTLARAIPKVAAEDLAALSVNIPTKLAMQGGALIGGAFSDMTPEQYIASVQQPMIPIAGAGELAREKIEEPLTRAGFPELPPTTNEQLRQDPVSTIARFAERAGIESLPYLATPVGGARQLAAGVAKPALRGALGAGAEAALFGGLSATEPLAAGEPVEALKRFGETTLGVLMLLGGGKALGAAARKLVARAAHPKVDARIRVSEADVSSGKAPDLSWADTEILPVLREGASVRGNTAMADAIDAEISRRSADAAEAGKIADALGKLKKVVKTRPTTTPPAPPAAPAVPPPNSDLELIERQNLESQAVRAERMGITPEELAAQTARGQRGELTQVAIREGNELPLAPPGEPELVGVDVANAPAPPVEPPAVAPQAPQTGVPTEGVPPGREGERGFISLEMLLGRKKGEGQRGGTLPAIGTVLPRVQEHKDLLDQVQKVQGRAFVPLENRVTESIGSIEESITNLALGVQKIAKQFEGAETASIEQAARLGESMEGRVLAGEEGMTGAGRVERRAIAPPVGPEQTLDIAVSQRQEMMVHSALIDLTKKIQEAKGQMVVGQGTTLQGLGLENLTSELHRLWRVYDAMGTAQGRTFAARKMTLEQMTTAAEELGISLDWMRRISTKPRSPLYPSIWRLSKKGLGVDQILERMRGNPEWRSMSSGWTDQERRQFVRDAVDAWRLNLFSTTSFTLDLFGNMTSIASEAADMAGRDLFNLFTHPKKAVGLLSLMSGFRRALKRAPTRVEQEFGLATPQGEAIGQGFGWKGTPGTFTGRESTASAMIDNTVGLPLYLKGAVDTAAKRWGAWAQLYYDARLAAQKAGVKGSERSAFIENWVNNAKPEDIARAIDTARRLGFSRELTNFENKLYASPLYKLFFGAFGRWPSQFIRGLGEWVGLSPTLWKRASKEGAAGIAGALTRMATGVGGLYLLNEHVYPLVDFKSMNLKDPISKLPMRLSSREPFPTALVLLAAARGDWKNFSDGLRYASIPGANVGAGEGGLLSSLMERINTAGRMRKFDPSALQTEVVRQLNKLIPGQAVLGLLKSIMDPTLRKGIGAEFPVVSLFQEPKIDPTTGEPIKPTQEFPPWSGFIIPQIGNTPIPGAIIQQDPVSRLLGMYGRLDYTAPRRPIAGVSFSDMPEEMQDAVRQVHGKIRTQKFAELDKTLMEKHAEIPYNERVALLGQYQEFKKLKKGGLSEKEAMDLAFGPTKWKQLVNTIPGLRAVIGDKYARIPPATRLALARMLDADNIEISKVEKQALDEAVRIVEEQVRSALQRREGRQ